MLLLVLLALAPLVSSTVNYSEHLTFKPLPNNKLLTSFEFESSSPSFPLVYADPDYEAVGLDYQPRHYGMFPKSVEPVIRTTNTRQLRLRFTQGWWNSESWGQLPRNGTSSGGTGVEIVASIEAPDLEAAKESWLKLSESLSGFFCASLNFVDDSITTFPHHNILGDEFNFASSPDKMLYVMRAALPDEPICTENLTPFLKMLPTRGKAGIASLLDGHKLYDSLWHSMSIDIATKCNSSSCWLQLDQSIHHIIDVDRSLRRRNEGGIPKPTSGDRLRCDLSKKHDSWTCFPLAESRELDYDLNSLFGRTIEGSGFSDGPWSSEVAFDLDRENWKVTIDKSSENDTKSHDASEVELLRGTDNYNVLFSTKDSNVKKTTKQPPILVSRSFTGYSQDKGGTRVSLRNTSPYETTRLIFFETLPWFMRVYLHTLKVTGDGKIESQFYRPAIDRKRPGHLELVISIPPGGDFAFTYQFDKSLLLYAEYPPDANHGFAIAPAVVEVLNDQNETFYQARTTSLLLTLPTPDFSMPYNVIILTCTVMSLAFGTIFNLLTKKVVTEEEFEEISKVSKISKLKSKLRAFMSKIKRQKQIEPPK